MKDSLFLLEFFVVAFTCGQVSLPVSADEELPEMTVSSPHLDLYQQINNFDKWDEENLNAAHERSIADVVEGSSGVSLTRTGGYGQQKALYVRGAGGQGLITLDGIPLLFSFPGLQNLDTLPVEAIQSAEIVRGPDSVKYPFQALGGSLRLYTYDRKEDGFRVSVEGGSYGILRETLQGAVHNSLGRMTLTLNRADAFEGTHHAIAKYNPERDPYRFSQAILRWGSDISNNLSMQGTLLYRNSYVGTDTIGLDKNFRVAYRDDPLSHGKGEMWLAQNTFDMKLAPDWSSQFQLGYTQSAATTRLSPYQSRITNRMYLATWRNQNTLVDDNRNHRQWTLNWGSQVRHEQADSEQMTVNDERTLISGFVDTEGRWSDLAGELGVRVEDYENFGRHALFKSALAWHVTSDLILRASGGNGYRIPSYMELFSLFLGNPLLKPERSVNGNLGLEWHIGKALRINVDGYYHRYDNLITQVYYPQRGPVTININDSSVSGLELGLQYAWTKSFNSGLSYTFSDSIDLQTKRLLPYRSPHTARIWTEQKFTKLPIALWTEVIVRSSTWNDTANTIPVDSSVQVNASIRYFLSEQFEVYLRGENLTNNRASQVYSLDMPGASVFGGFRLNL